MTVGENIRLCGGDYRTKLNFLSNWWGLLWYIRKVNTSFAKYKLFASMKIAQRKAVLIKHLPNTI